MSTALLKSYVSYHDEFIWKCLLITTSNSGAILAEQSWGWWRGGWSQKARSGSSWSGDWDVLLRNVHTDVPSLFSWPAVHLTAGCGPYHCSKDGDLCKPQVLNPSPLESQSSLHQDSPQSSCSLCLSWQLSCKTEGGWTAQPVAQPAVSFSWIEQEAQSSSLGHGTLCELQNIQGDLEVGSWRQMCWRELLNPSFPGISKSRADVGLKISGPKHNLCKIPSHAGIRHRLLFWIQGLEFDGFWCIKDKPWRIYDLFSFNHCVPLNVLISYSMGSIWTVVTAWVAYEPSFFCFFWNKHVQGFCLF